MDHTLTNLGLCNRARGLVAGEDIVCDYMRQGKIKYVFLANDSSDNAKKKITNKATFYNVEVNMNFSSAELSQAIGQFNRMVIGITDEKFLKILRK